MKPLHLLLLLLPITTLAQRKSKDTVLKYLDLNLEVTTANKGAFIGVAVKVNNGWYLHALYPDTSLLLIAC